MWNEACLFILKRLNTSIHDQAIVCRDLFIGNSTDSRYSPGFQSNSDGKVTRRATSIRCVDKGVLWKRLLFTREQRSPFVLHSFSEHCNPMEGNE